MPSRYSALKLMELWYSWQMASELLPSVCAAVYQEKNAETKFKVKKYVEYWQYTYRGIRSESAIANTLQNHLVTSDKQFKLNPVVKITRLSKIYL